MIDETRATIQRNEEELEKLMERLRDAEPGSVLAKKLKEFAEDQRRFIEVLRKRLDTMEFYEGRE